MSQAGLQQGDHFIYRGAGKDNSTGGYLVGCSIQLENEDPYC